jgi:hypothetical protein
MELLTDIIAAVIAAAAFLGAIATIIRYIIRPVRDVVDAGRDLVVDINEAKEEFADLTRIFLRVVAEYDARFERLERAAGLPPYIHTARSTG